MYKITVTKQRQETEEERKARHEEEDRRRRGYGFGGDERNDPSPRFIDEKHLEATLTDEEFDAVKKAVIACA